MATYEVFFRLEPSGGSIDTEEYNIKSFSDNDMKQMSDNGIFCPGCLSRMTFVKSGKNGRKRHIRHKNSCTNNMTKWHKDWQNEFPGFTEIMVGDHIADVKSENLVIEFQHSQISKEEVDSRRDTYKNKYGHILIWVIDGTISPNNAHYNKKNWDNVVDNVFELGDKYHYNRKYVEFKNSWPYKNFARDDIIFIDINSRLYRLFPGAIKNRQYDIDGGYSRQEFVNAIKNGESNKLLAENIPKQCTLFIKQQCAGSGKTYNIIRSFDEKRFMSYKYIIIASKQHSAKHIINKELREQSAEENENRMKTEFYSFDTNNPKKYNYSAFHNNEIIPDNLLKLPDKYITICTIDSLLFNVFNGNISNITGPDKFISLAKKIAEGNIDEKRLNDSSIFLNKKTCIIIDETQDLHFSYGQALVKIMEERHVDAYIVGDCLQSIKYVNNAFSQLRSLDSNNNNAVQIGASNIINIKNEPVVNATRRFNHPELINLVNSIMPFKKYGLPEITSVANNDRSKDAPFYIDVFKNPNDGDQCINSIVEVVKNEVKNNGRKPEDFLIVSPIIKNNRIMNFLADRLTMFFADELKDGRPGIYVKLHKSDEGQPIDLSESKKAVRMVSIHSAKGDGRPVVIVVGLSELALKCFDRDQITECHNLETSSGQSLVYESLLNVSLTRMKEKLYVFLNNRFDDIGRRFSNHIDKDTSFGHKISNNTLLSSLVQNQSATGYEKISSIIEKRKFFDDHESDKPLIGMGHHLLRRYAMRVCLSLFAWKNGSNNTTAGIIFGKLRMPQNIEKIKKAKPYEPYKRILRKNFRGDERYESYKRTLQSNFRGEEKKVPLVKLSNKNESYIKYYETIKKSMRYIQEKMCQYGNEVDICPYECIVLNYMVETWENGHYTKISINDLYELTIIYNQAWKNADTDLHHGECSCQFMPNITYEDHNKQLVESITNHYALIKEFQKQLRDNFDINADYYVPYHKSIGYKNDYRIRCFVDGIIICDDSIYIVFIEPEINNLNIEKILAKSLLFHYFIKSIWLHPDSNEKQNIFNNKCKDKVIKTAIITPQTCLKEDWHDKDGENLIKKYQSDLNNFIRHELIEKYKIQSQNIPYSLGKLLRDKKDKRSIKEKINKIIIDAPFKDEFVNRIKKQTDYSTENIEKILNEVIEKTVEKFTDNRFETIS